MPLVIRFEGAGDGLLRVWVAGDGQRLADEMHPHLTARLLAHDAVLHQCSPEVEDESAERHQGADGREGAWPQPLQKAASGPLTRLQEGQTRRRGTPQPLQKAAPSALSR